MDHGFTESQTLLKRTAADYFAREFPLDRIRDFREDRPHGERQLWQGICSLGWNAAPFPEWVGGYPGSFADAAVLLEEMGRGCAASPYVHSTIAAGLVHVGTDMPCAVEVAENEGTVIPVPMVRGRTRGERPAERTISGRFEAVPWVELASQFLIPREDGSLALVGAHAHGVSAQRLDSAGAESLGVVEAKDVEVSLVLPPSAAEELRLNGAAGASLLLLGASERALDLAVAYMKERVQFGKPIGAFQALQHRAADMSIAIEVGRNLAHKAATVHGSPEFGRAAHYAKGYWSEAAQKVTREAIQFHGGVGFVDDHKVQLCYRLAMSLANQYGSAGEHRTAVTDLVLAGQRA